MKVMHVAQGHLNTGKIENDALFPPTIDLTWPRKKIIAHNLI